MVLSFGRPVLLRPVRLLPPAYLEDPSHLLHLVCLERQVLEHRSSHLAVQVDRVLAHDHGHSEGIDQWLLESESDSEEQVGAGR